MVKSTYIHSIKQRYNFLNIFQSENQYIENCFKEIKKQKQIIGIIAVNQDGNPIKSTFDDKSTLQFTGMFNQMVDKGKSAIKQIEETDELVSLRIQTKKHEIILTPDHKKMFIVFQGPTVD